MKTKSKKTLKWCDAQLTNLATRSTAGCCHLANLVTKFQTNCESVMKVHNESCNWLSMMLPRLQMPQQNQPKTNMTPAITRATQTKEHKRINKRT